MSGTKFPPLICWADCSNTSNLLFKTASYNSAMSSYFELRGRELDVASAKVYENSRWESPPIATITNEIVAVEGIVLANRVKGILSQDPYAYIGRTAEGVWLKEADYKVHEGITAGEMRVRLFELCIGAQIDEPKKMAEIMLPNILRQDYDYFFQGPRDANQAFAEIYTLLAGNPDV